MAKYVELPDGNLFPVKEGESLNDAMEEAYRLHPQAFGVIPEEKAPAKGSKIKDLATEFGQSALGSTKALTDIFGAENVASKFLEERAKKLGEGLSPERKAELAAQQERMRQAEATGSMLEELKAGAQNVAEAPLQSLAQATGSLVPYALTSVVGTAARFLKLAPTTVETLQGLLSVKNVATAQGVGAVKGSIYDAVYQKELEASQNPDLAARKAELAQNYIGKNIDQIVIGGGLGRLAGSAGAERLLTKAGMAEAPQAMIPRIAKAGVEEFLTEAPQGGQERLAANLASQRAGFDVPTMQGVVGQAVQEGLMGTLGAAPVAALRGPGRGTPPAPLAAEPEVPTTEAAPTAETVPTTAAEIEEPILSKAAKAKRELDLRKAKQAEMEGFGKPGAIAQPEPEMTYEEYDKYRNQLRLVDQRLDDLRTRAQGITNPVALQKLAQQEKQLLDARAGLEKLTAKPPLSPEQEVNKYQAKHKRLIDAFNTAKENGDIQAQARLAQQLYEHTGRTGEAALRLEEPPEQLSFPMELTPKGKSGAQARAEVFKPGAPEAEAEEAAFLAEQPAPNAWDAYRAELRRRQEEATAKEIAAMEAGRLETGETVQGDLFGETATKAVTGGRKEERPSEAQTVAALRIARLTGNRSEASNLVETLRDIREEQKKPERVITPETAETIAGGRVPIRANMQAQAADARATAYADVVNLISKYNRGVAKGDELQEARNRLLENMVNDVEATTGKPMSDTDRAQMERDANRLLNELVARFGDTRNMSMKGGRKQPLFVFQQTKGGEFTKGEVPGAGFPTVESAIPGMRTFGNPFAASMSIKEGLDELRNKAVGVSQGPTFTRTLTQPTTTPSMLLGELDQAFAKGEEGYDADTRKTLLQVADNLNAISANPDNRSVVTDWVYRTRIGQDTTERTQEVKDILRGVEEAKRSETETLPSGEIRRAIQTEIPTGEERGKVFATPAEFEQYLASDALQQLRSDMRISGPTLSRLVARLKPFQERAAKLREEGELYVEEWNRLYALRRKQLDELATLNQDELAEQTKQIAAAEELVKEAQARLTAMESRLDEDLRALDIAYQDAALKFEYSVKTSEDITQAIKDNFNLYNAPAEKALYELLEAKSDLRSLASYEKHPRTIQDRLALTKGKTFEEGLGILKDLGDTGLQLAQMRVEEATRKFYNMLNLSTTDKRILDYLQKDIELQAQFAEEAATMDKAAKDMLNAQMALYEAKDRQERSAKNKQERKQIQSEIDSANETLAEEKAKLQEIKDTISDIEKDLGFTTQTINHRISEVQSRVVVSLKRASTAEAEMADMAEPLMTAAQQIENTASRAYNAFIKRREAALGVREETTAEKEARDNEQRRLENDMLERMAAMPGERISFELRRRLIEQSGTSEQAIGELMDAAEDAQQTLDRMKEADVKLAQKIDALDKDIAKLEKQTAAEPRTFKGKLEKQSRLVELGGLREQRDAMLKTREQLATGMPLIEKAIADVDAQIPKLLVEKDYIENTILSDNPEVRSATLDRLEKTITKSADGMKRVQVKLGNMVPPKAGASEETVEKYKKLRKSRQNDLSRYKREYNDAVAKRDAMRGVERTQLPVEPLATEPVVAGTRLGARTKGPVARKAVQAGNVRTGEPTTTGERKLSTRNKPVQTGQKKRLTTAQVLKAVNEDVSFEQAMLASDEMETRIVNTTRARDAAIAAGDTERSAEMDRKLDSMNKVLDKLQVKAAKGIKAPTKVLSAEDYENFPEYYEGLGTTYRDMNVTDANPVVKDFLRKDNLEAALRQLVKGAQTGLLREHAQKVLPYIKDTKVVIKPNLTLRGDSVPAYYDPASNTIYFDPRGMSEENIVHEAVHAATKVVWETPDSQLTASQRQAKTEIEAMYKAAVKNKALTGEYALKNAEEFMSEMQSNERFRAAMNKQPWYKRFASAIMRLLGFTPKETEAARASRLIEQLYSPSKAFAAEAVGAAPTQPATKLEQFAADMIAQPQTLRQRVGNNPALELEMQGVDMRAALRDVLKHGDDKLFKQAMYNVRKADQKMPQVYTVLNNGPLELYKDDKGFIGVRSTNKNAGKEVFDAIASIPLASGKAKVDVATAYMVAQRAVSKSGQIDTQRLLGVDEEKVRAVLAEVDRNPALKKALENVRTKYNAYNKGMIDFNVATGAMTKAQGEELTKAGDYVPYYRVTENGMAELVYGDNTIISIGDIRNQPYLAQLKGGPQKILPLSESLYQNTLLLTDKALTNLATRNVAYGMQALGEGKGPINKETGKPRNTMPIHKGAGPADPSVIRFSQEPDPNDPKDDGRRWLKVETKGTVAEGVPAELVVKSLEGAHLPLPAFLKMAGAFTDVLRSGVTRMPPYILRQLIRDPMAATFTGGLNYGPLTAVLKAGTEFFKQSTGQSQTAAKLLEKGLIQSNIFTGDADDMSKIALQIASGKDQNALEKMFAALDRYALRADAATRVLVYENALKNGLSEVEADMMTMESMNFYKRGLNPAVQYANRLIPFINAQIQGLNVLVKAFRGNMPFEQQLEIRQKFFNRAMFLFSVGFVYALAMDDDDTFKNARPRDKYNNFFLHLPGTEEAFKIPIPFEAGYFYSVAVALADAMKKETNTQEQWEALRDMFLNSIPGWSSRGVPQIAKPVFEVFTNKNFMSGAPIETARMEGKDITERFNASTTEFAKGLSKALPFLSPVQIEHIARGYLGVAPLAAMGTMDSFLRSEKAGEAPERRLSETPVIGTLFQKQYGGADADVMYRMSKEAMEAKETFNAMRKAGRMDDAREFLESHRAEIASASAAGSYRQAIGRLNTDADRTRNRADLSAAEKRQRLDAIDARKQELANQFMRRFESISDRTIRP